MIRAAIFEPEDDLIAKRAIETLTFSLLKPFSTEDEQFEVVTFKTLEKFIDFFMLYIQNDAD